MRNFGWNSQVRQKLKKLETHVVQLHMYETHVTNVTQK